MDKKIYKINYFIGDRGRPKTIPNPKCVGKITEP